MIKFDAKRDQTRVIFEEKTQFRQFTSRNARGGGTPSQDFRSGLCAIKRDNATNIMCNVWRVDNWHNCFHFRFEELSQKREDTENRLTEAAANNPAGSPKQRPAANRKCRLKTHEYQEQLRREIVARKKNDPLQMLKHNLHQYLATTFGTRLAPPSDKPLFETCYATQAEHKSTTKLALFHRKQLQVGR